MQQSIFHCYISLHCLFTYKHLWTISEPNHKEQEYGHPLCIWNKINSHIHIEYLLLKYLMASEFDCNYTLCNKLNFYFFEYIVCIVIYYIPECMLLWMSTVNDRNIHPTGISRNDILPFQLSILYYLSSNSCKMHGDNQSLLIPHHKGTQDRFSRPRLTSSDHWTLLMLSNF